jgi:glyoxylase-like metal-dependent hydrolase (beta-lactamase superfamily II)
LDPSLKPQKITNIQESNQSRPATILNTHGHANHIGGNAAIKNRWPECRLAIGADECSKLANPAENLSELFAVGLTSPPADVLLTDGQVFSAAGLDFRVIRLPGHSCGHVVYLLEEHNPPVAFVGDVIFAGSIGRTDFPDGDMRQLAAGIRQRLYTLPDDAMLLPGHGPATTVGREKRTNPFVRP